jgi:hypothetical protein
MFKNQRCVEKPASNGWGSELADGAAPGPLINGFLNAAPAWCTATGETRPLWIALAPRLV